MSTLKWYTVRTVEGLDITWGPIHFRWTMCSHRTLPPLCPREIRARWPREDVGQLSRTFPRHAASGAPRALCALICPMGIMWEPRWRARERQDSVSIDVLLYRLYQVSLTFIVYSFLYFTSFLLSLYHFLINVSLFTYAPTNIRLNEHLLKMFTLPYRSIHLEYI